MSAAAPFDADTDADHIPPVPSSPTFSDMNSEDSAMRNSCMSCRQSKVKCDKDLPCARCVRLKRECIPQARGAGRPHKNYNGNVSSAPGSPGSVSGSSVSSGKHAPAPHPLPFLSPPPTLPEQNLVHVVVQSVLPVPRTSVAPNLDARGVDDVGEATC